MKSNKLVPVVLVMVAFCWTASAQFEPPGMKKLPFKFDMGTKDSPIAEGYMRVTPNNIRFALPNDPMPRYGFVGEGFADEGREAFLSERPENWNPHQLSLGDHFDKHVTPVTVDGVRSTKEIKFRVDVPPGKYRIIVTLGDLNTPMGSISLFANSNLIEKNIALHHGLYRYIADVTRPMKGSMGVTGFYDRIRFNVDAPDGVIEISAKGDQSDYDRWFKEDNERGVPIGRLPFQVDAWHDTEAPLIDIGEPFVCVPLQGVEIYPYVEPPIVETTPGALAYSGSDPAVRNSVAACNSGDFPKAESALDKASRLQDPLGAALAYLWLIGHPNNDHESDLIVKARPLLEGVIAKEPENQVALEALENLDAFERGLTRHLNRASSKNHFIENIRACHLFQLAQPGDPLYWKSILLAGRCCYMLDPMHRGVSASSGYRWMKEVLDNFPDNPYARFFVNGDFDHTKGPWQVPNYSAHVKGAPEWAGAIYTLYNYNLDLAEWWFQNKQRPDGSIGGGWGDDVESACWLGLFAMMSEGASPLNIEGLSRICRGVFDNSGDIDPDTNFIHMQNDFEHATEWTGDTLPLMQAAEFGNPLWIERSYGTARLMKNLWTGINSKGYRHFRHFHIGGMSIGTDPEGAQDRTMAYRGVLPVERLYWYNQHPEVGKLLVEWAEAWRAAAMSDAGGKPAGFIPNTIWYEDGSPVRSQNGDSYNIGSRGTHGYGICSILLGYTITGDEKFLDPLRLESAAYEALADVEETKKREKNKKYSDGYIKYVLGQSHDLLRKLEPPKDGVYKPYYTYAEAAESCAGKAEDFRSRWPMWTTEASATDRVGSGKLMDQVMELMAAPGLGQSGPILTLAVSFQGIGRDFASLLQANYLHRLSVALYIFRDGPIDMAIRPWDLQVGCTYKLTVAPDADENGIADSAGYTSTYECTSRGVPCPIKIEGRKTHIVTLELIGDPKPAKPTPDYAVSEEDIQFFQMGYGEYITVEVHNTGSADAGEAMVMMYEGTPEDGTKIGERLISNLGWPRDLLPQKIKLGWGYTPKSKEATFTVVVDTENAVDEIVETNNRATRTIRFEE